jgi:hypothetical protein
MIMLFSNWNDYLAKQSSMVPLKNKNATINSIWQKQ